MAQKTDNSILARTNPVFLTAKTAVALMAEAGIPGAEDIAKRLKKENSVSAPAMTDPQMILGNAVVVEAKYRTMCRLIEESGYRTNIDLPCGFTPKALHLTERGLRFIGLDLPIVANEMGPVISELSKHPDQIRFRGIDATNYDSLHEALCDEQGPFCISTEGMMMYFTENEVSTVVSNIQRLLETYGGCWITPDPEFILQFFLTFRALFGEGAIKTLMASRNTATGQSDVSNLTNSLILNPEDIPASAGRAANFLRKHGLQAEKINLADHMPELSVYRKLSKEQIEAFREAMRLCHYWKITISEEARPRAKENSLKGQGFGMDYAFDGEVFRIRLRGRIDTISAPELLKVWEEETKLHPVGSVEIDCSLMDYISSAGLRVLLIMHKSCREGVTLTGVSPLVKEIIEQTGFDSVLRVMP